VRGLGHDHERPVGSCAELLVDEVVRASAAVGCRVGPRVELAETHREQRGGEEEQSQRREYRPPQRPRADVLAPAREDRVLMLGIDPGSAIVVSATPLASGLDPAAAYTKQGRYERERGNDRDTDHDGRGQAQGTDERDPGDVE